MISFLHTPPSSPSEGEDVKPTVTLISTSTSSSSLVCHGLPILPAPPVRGTGFLPRGLVPEPSFIPPPYVTAGGEHWQSLSPDYHDRRKRKLVVDGGHGSNDTPQRSQKSAKISVENPIDDKINECRHLFDNKEDFLQAVSVLKERRDVDIRKYSHQGIFIPTVLLSLSQGPRLGKSPPSTVKPHPKVPTTKCKGDNPAKPYICQYCGKQFTNVGNLVTHSRTHTKEKPFKCDKCDLEFAHTSNLQRHQLVHSGERNNKCPHCNKSFSRSDYLKVHQRTHTGEKPYQCSIAGCSKRFLDSSSLKKHERTHNSGRSYTCHICCKSFNEVGKFRSHMTTHAVGSVPDNRKEKENKSMVNMAPLQPPVYEKPGLPLVPLPGTLTRPIPHRPAALPVPMRRGMASLPRSTRSDLSAQPAFSAFIPFPN